MARLITIHGLDEAHDALVRLGRKGAVKIVRKGVRAGLRIIQRAEIAQAPNKFGLLRDSIRLSTRAKRGELQGTVGPKSKKFKTPTKGNPKAHFYPAFIIHGYKKRTPKTVKNRLLRIFGVTTGGMVPPNAFVQRAYDQAADEATQKAVDIITEAIPAAFDSNVDTN